MAEAPLESVTMAGAEPLKRLLAGELEQGLRLYRDALTGESARKLPIGLHLLFLERAGQREAAEALRTLAVRRGATIALKAGGFGAAPAEAAAEYEALFANGLVNAFMVSEYLVALSLLGRFDDLARWLDTDRLLYAATLELQVPGAGVPLADAILAAILAREESADFQPAVQSVREMFMIKDFPRSGDPAVAALVDAVRRQSSDYLERWAESDHPLASFVPRRFELSGWALISRGAGYNVPHVHNLGWATAVYYPAAVSGGGQLQVGRPEAGAGSADQWGARSFTPRPGLFVLMPSFYTHWTVPMTQPGLRTAVAFDLLAESGGAGD